MGAAGLGESTRICGENLFARHSISYRSLPSHFMVFGIFEGDVCLAWDETQVRACWAGQSTASLGDEQEDFVVRLAGRFEVDHFATSTARSEKWSRRGSLELQRRPCACTTRAQGAS